MSRLVRAPADSRPGSASSFLGPPVSRLAGWTVSRLDSRSASRLLSASEAKQPTTTLGVGRGGLFGGPLSLRPASAGTGAQASGLFTSTP
jgi:hypothetical protein